MHAFPFMVLIGAKQTLLRDAQHDAKLGTSQSEVMPLDVLFCFIMRCFCIVSSVYKHTSLATSNWLYLLYLVDPQAGHSMHRFPT